MLDIPAILRKYIRPLEREDPTEPKIHVDEVASQVAAVYEKVRSIADYREEHLLRKSFIKRAYERDLVLHGESKIADPLIRDLIRAGHLKNDTVPESEAAAVQAIVDRGQAIREFWKDMPGEKRRSLADWLQRVIIQAIEEYLFPPSRDRIIAETGFFDTKENLRIQGGEAPEEENITSAIFMSVQQAILRADDDQILYRFLSFLEPDWLSVPETRVGALAARLPDVRKRIARAMRDPLNPRFRKFMAKRAVVYQILGDVLSKARREEVAEVMFRDPDAFATHFREAYKKRFAGEKKKLRRFAILSVISFFLTKIAIALAIEIPIQQNLTHDFSWANTLLNMVIPPILMLIIVISVRMPGAKNEGLVLAAAEAVVFNKKREYVLKMPKGPEINPGAEIFYGMMFVVSLGGSAWALMSIGFSIADILIFILFTSLVAATGVRVYNRSKELSLEKQHRNFLTLVGDAFILPYVAIGGKIIEGLSKFNIFLMLIDLFIDLPFQVFVAFLENVSNFLKGMKEEVT